MTQASQALTHMNNPKITRNPLPAILAGLFILAGCGGSALPIDVLIETKSDGKADNLETNAPDSIFLSVNEQPPVEKQEAEQKQEQDPAPVFEVAVAPASPPQRSFSQAEPEPQTSTETVTRSDATGQSNHDDGAITFADWTGSFSFSGDKKLPTQAETKTITITSTPVYTSTAPTTRTKTAGVKNEFLQGGAGGRLDEAPRDAGPAGQVANRGSLNLATATFGGRKLGGKATNGVAFFRGFGALNPSSSDSNLYIYPYKYTIGGLTDNNNVHNYAGLYSGTNLGAPVPTSGQVASWNGQFRSIGRFDFDTDFTLLVNFEGTALTIAKTINPRDKTQSFTASARYDTNGVITGEVRFGSGTNAINIGVLTGLIGADGAVGAFLATGMSNENGGNTLAVAGDKNGLTDGFGSHGYAGGFVASPTAVANEDVTIDAWTGSFTNALPRGVKKHVIGQGDHLNQFLLRENPAKRPNWNKKEGGFLGLRTFIDGTDDTVNNPTSLGGDATDGVDFFTTDITLYWAGQSGTARTYHAGIWDSTDLGAAIPDGVAFNGKTSAMWKGKFSVFQGANARFDTDFMLTVNFDTPTINATITATNSEFYYLSGDYDRASGVIDGRVRYGPLGIADAIPPYNGILTGLIGQEGAVGVFISNNAGTDKDDIRGGTGDEGYAGGFVAISTPAIDARSLPNYNDIPVTLAGLKNIATPNRGFLRIADGEELNTAGITSPTPFTGRRDSTADSAGFGDGYTFVRNGGYAAILPTTYLGMPRPVGDGQATDARWTGTYSLGGDLATNETITFDINFRVSTLTGTAPLTSSSSNNITIYTTFGPTGVMHGTFSTDTATAIEAGDTRVIGLIGTEGLVGIMHGQDTAGAVVSGGFVASP